MDEPPSDVKLRVTLRDMAQRLGLSHSTVSMALRDHPRIAPKTKLLVQEEAARCGFRPDPMLSALAAYRQGRRPSAWHGTLAWLVNEEMTDTSLFREYWEGARQRAESLGYQLNEYIIRKHGMPPKRLSEILRARNVQGILVAPQVHTQPNLDMRWEWFSSVAFGFSLEDPSLHLVTSTQYRNGIRAHAELQKLGYKRIGYFSCNDFNQRTDQNFIAGLHVAALAVPASRRAPPLVVAGERHSIEGGRKIREWITHHRVDAVISGGGWHPMLLDAGYKVPEDIAVALLSVEKTHPNYAGIDEKGKETGVAAVDILVGMIQRGDRGIPPTPYRLLIEGQWVDGLSAPPKSAQISARKSVPRK